MSKVLIIRCDVCGKMIWEGLIKNYIFRGEDEICKACREKQERIERCKGNL